MSTPRFRVSKEHRGGQRDPLNFKPPLDKDVEKLDRKTRNELNAKALQNKSDSAIMTEAMKLLGQIRSVRDKKTFARNFKNHTEQMAEFKVRNSRLYKQYMAVIERRNKRG